VLLTIGQLCTSTLNVKKFLERGLLDELINLLLLAEDDNIKKEALLCLSKVSVSSITLTHQSRLGLSCKTYTINLV